MVVISGPEILDKILVHLMLPFSPDTLADGCTPAFDVTDQTIPDWIVGTNPEGHSRGYECGPPCAFDGVDPPCPDDVFDA